MPTEENRKARRARTQRVLAELEREILAAKAEGREPDSGKVLEENSLVRIEDSI